jgi:hypothetical protein
MDPAALLNPRGARQRGTKPTSSTFETPSFSFSNPYSTTNDNMSQEPDYWQPAQPFAMQQPMSPQVNHGARAPDVPQPMNYTAAQQQDYLPAGPQFQRFDAGALLNPRSASKRPATDQEQQPERGREDSAAAGQVSLVERLHHVQERTASPAKRARTEDEPKAPKSHSAFAHGSALDLNRNSQQPPPTQGTAIDLTMSTSLTLSLLEKCSSPANMAQATMKMSSRWSRTTLRRSFASANSSMFTSKLTKYPFPIPKNTPGTTGR